MKVGVALSWDFVTREADADGDDDTGGVEEGTACENSAEVWVDWGAIADDVALSKGGIGDEDDGIAGLLLRVTGPWPGRETMLDAAGTNNSVTAASSS